MKSIVDYDLSSTFIIKFTIVLVIFIMLSFIGRDILKLSNHLLKKSQPHRNILKSTINFICALFIILGLIITFASIRVNITSLITSLGLIGFIVVFAFKNVIYKSFIYNNKIKVLDIEDVVQTNIQTNNFKHSILADKEKKFLIPNYLLIANPVIILS